MGSQLNRRDLIRGAVGWAAASTLSAWPTRLRAQGANGDVRIGIIGVGGKGSAHLKEAAKLQGVRVVAISDPDTEQMTKAITALEKAEYPHKVTPHKDIRKLLESKDVDAVIVATPNHWHALAGIWACQAGKDAYVEKPVSYNMFEGRKLVEAARKYKRVVYHGIQRRSDLGQQEVCEYLKSGALGKLKFVQGPFFRLRESIGKATEPLQPPPSIDYDLWLGPAAKEPLMRLRFHYDWHWFWNTGNGEIGNNGPHQLDLARRYLGDPLPPPRVLTIAGRFLYDDDAQTPNSGLVFYDFPGAPLIYEFTNLPLKPGVKAVGNYKGIKEGAVAHCENGYIAGGFAYDNSDKKIEVPGATDPKKKFKSFTLDNGRDHLQNFINSVRKRELRPGLKDIEVGHYSTCLCHLGNTSYRLGKEAPPGAILEQIKGNPQALATFERMKAHLSDLGIRLDESKAVLGQWLEFDAKKEVFTGDSAPEANKLLRRAEYRKPYVVPDKV
ncbi:MAG TPA: Gfo/Idh/MocA family oxidoreductase [Verrucomicrobiae bacterium]|nr:Gfo/Idh/MocA family oxidoreductase [Verrucomicrobiae bacterium]